MTDRVARSRGREVSGRDRETARPRDRETSDFIDAVTKARPLIGGYLAGAKGHRRDGNRVIFTFDDRFSADSVASLKMRAPTPA